VPGTTSGRLVAAGLELFGAHGFSAVAVTTIAERAGVTTGSLYHHFGSKAGLYQLVRGDVEQRVLDRFEGAAAERSVRGPADLAPILLVGYDYLVRSGYPRLLGETPPQDRDEVDRTDAIEERIARLVNDDHAPLAALVAAAWRAALWHASAGPDPAQDARAALVRLLTTT